MHIFKNKKVKTKKRHRCEWCNEWIEAGEAANYREYIVEGDFYHGHMHLECDAAMMSGTAAIDNDDGWMPGDFKRGSVEMNN